MNTLELKHFLLQDPICAKHFGGVISADHLANLILEDGKVYIINTSISSLPGTHWVLIYKDPVKKNVEYWDSLAKFPWEYGYYFTKFFSGITYICNTVRLQGRKKVCGEYTLYFSYYRCRGYTMNSIVNHFSNDLVNNDSIVEIFVKNHTK